MVNTKKKHILKNPQDIFFGWWLALAGGFLCLFGYSYSAYGFSALFKPISRELGISRAAASIAPSITRFEGGIEAPLVGYLADKYGPRITVFIGVFMIGLGLVLMYFVNSFWTFILYWSVILSTGTNIALSMPLDVAIANWFVRKRGTAMSIRQVFSGLSGVIGLPTIAFLIVHYGWRTACLSGGLFMWVVGLPLVYFFIRAKRPEYYGLLPDGAVVDASDNTDAVEAGKRYAAEAGEVEFTTKQAMSTRAFWMLIAAYMFHGALVPVMNIHAIPFLTDRGMEPFRAAATMSIYITASIPARFLGGFIVDRVTTTSIRFVMAGAYFLQAAGVILFLLNQQSMLSLYTFFIIYGLGMGAVMPMTPVIRARYFGRASFGTIAGISRAMNMPVGVVGPIAAGWIYDATGSYISAFILFAILLAVSGLIMAATGPPKPPVRSAELSAS